MVLIEISGEIDKNGIWERIYFVYLTFSVNRKVKKTLLLGDTKPKIKEEKGKKKRLSQLDSDDSY